MYDISDLGTEQKATICMTVALNELLSYMGNNNEPVKVDLAFKSDSSVYLYSVSDAFLQNLHNKQNSENIIHADSIEMGVYDNYQPTLSEIKQLFVNQIVDDPRYIKMSLLCEPRLVVSYDEHVKIYAVAIGYKGTIHSDFWDCIFSSYITKIKTFVRREKIEKTNVWEQKSWGNVARKAAGRFLSLKIYGKTNDIQGEELYETLCLISSASYERSQNHGRMGMLTEGVQEKDTFIRFSEPVEIKRDNIRQIRKLLEMSDARRNMLMIEKGSIVGIYTPKEGFNNTEIVFHGNGKWDFRIQKNPVIIFNAACIVLKNRMLEPCIEDSISATFGNKCNMDLLKRIISDAKKQKHGTTIIISDKAEDESERLSEAKRAIKIDPVNVEKVQSITAIDGAVLLDQYGKCYAIGAILDGESGENGSLARGARYNSAITYTDYWGKRKKHHIVAVIISEDDSVDIYPPATI